MFFVHSIITFLCILFQVSCFDELRTKKCLGYTLLCFHNSHDEGGSFNIIVLSQKCHPNKVIATIHEFLRNTYEKVIAPSHFRRVFSEAKKSVQKDLIFNMQTVLDTSRQFWRGVQKGDKDYNLSKQNLIALSTLNYAHFRSLYLSGILDVQSRKMLIVVLYNKEVRDMKLNVDCLIQYHLINQFTKNLESACL